MAHIRNLEVKGRLGCWHHPVAGQGLGIAAPLNYSRRELLPYLGS